jgi:hypothetical protein
MFAFAALGENYFADGAMAGLATALIVAVVCVVLGDRTTTVYAPRVNRTFFLGLLIYGLVHSGAPEIEGGGAVRSCAETIGAMPFTPENRVPLRTVNSSNGPAA